MPVTSSDFGSMLVPGALMLLVAFLYWKFTQDCPAGNYKELRARGVEIESGKKGGWAVFLAATRNYRAWMLFVTYGACFGIELFVHNVAASYYVDRYKLDLQSAGMAAGAFGLLALFARAVGGILSDRLARAKGLDARTTLLFALMLGEGLGLLWFSSTATATLPAARAAIRSCGLSPTTATSAGTSLAAAAKARTGAASGFWPRPES